MCHFLFQKVIKHWAVLEPESIQRVIDHEFENFRTLRGKYDRFHGVLLGIWNRRLHALYLLGIINEGMRGVCRFTGLFQLAYFLLPL